MIKKDIEVPRGVRYISDWAKQVGGFQIPDHPCIIDKGLTGCGFTEYCINSEYNGENIILCSPRKMLLENKNLQNPGTLYVVNEYEASLGVDKDLTATVNKTPDNYKDLPEEPPEAYQIGMKDKIKYYVGQAMNNVRPAKILVTYDSFRIVKEALSDIGVLGNFRVVIDEFQSIFTDSTFKSGTELEFVWHLQGIQKVCFVSATPMIDKYLEKMDEFKYLLYYRMNWASADPLRVIRPELKVSAFGNQSLMAIANNIIQEYLRGNYEVMYGTDSSGTLIKRESKEAIFFVNSVKNIRDMIRKAGLKPDQCNILCADTPKNLKSLRIGLKSKDWTIGRVPLRHEPRKMFTFCTRTVYLGADFYSDNARSFILSDANIECMAVDITLDLPQILGRQRLEENPWKSRAELYVKLLRRESNQVAFNKLVLEKEERSRDALRLHELGEDGRMKSNYSETLLRDVINSNYKYNYVAVNRHTGSTMQPCFNTLVRLAEERAFEIQKTDYADRFQLFNALMGNCNVDQCSKEINDFLEKFYQYGQFTDRMRLLCEVGPELSTTELDVLLKQVPGDYGKYYSILGPDQIKAAYYNSSRMRMLIDRVVDPFKPESLDSDVYSEFKEGDRISLKGIKEVLKLIYQNNDVPKATVASDIKSYFETKDCLVSISDGSRQKGYKLVKKLR